MYLKLSIRNARRSFTDYLLYIVTMAVLLAVMEVSNCIAITGELADFQTVSLPLLITAIQIILVGYIDAFMLKQRAKEFANYLLLGMEKKKLINLFLCEILLIGFFCFLTGTTTGFAICGFRYGKSIVDTFCYFCFMEIICIFRLKQRLNKLQIRELTYEKNRNQSMNHKNNYKSWGIIFFSSFTCLIGLVCGIVFLPENNIVYLISVASVPLLLSVFAFYKWMFGYLYAYRKRKPVTIYQKNRLYLIANITSNFKTSAAVNAVFCICFLFSALSFITGRLMLRPEFQLFDRAVQEWMGTLQISICVIFITIYFSILSLQQMIELRQDSKKNQILRYIGKNSGQIKTLVKQQIAIKLTLPMIMALIIFLVCMPLLNRKMNLILPVTMRNALFRFAGEFFLCTLLFYLCYFFIVNAISRQYINNSI